MFSHLLPITADGLHLTRLRP